MPPHVTIKLTLREAEAVLIASRIGSRRLAEPDATMGVVRDVLLAAYDRGEAKLRIAIDDKRRHTSECRP